MASNNFIEFNPNKQNIMTDSEYTDESQRLNGVSGIAKAKMHNKLYRQLSVMAAAIGEFIKGTGNDASDSDVSTLVTSISKAFASKTALDQRSIFEVAQGTGTAITLSSAVATDKFSTTFIAAHTNSAAKTINGKPWYKPGTTTSPATTSGKAYTIWYDASGVCFFLKASATGNATADKVLAPYTISNDDDTDIVGTMVDNGSVGNQTLSTNNAEYVIPAGYHNGLGKVKAVITGLIAGVIKSGTTVGGILGTFTSDATATAAQMLLNVTAYVNGAKVTGTIPSKTAQTYNPSTSAQTIASGQYLSGTQTIAATTGTATVDKVLAGYTFNSSAGIGLTGTAQAVTGARGTATKSGTSLGFYNPYTSSVQQYKYITVSGLAFIPKYIMLKATSGTGSIMYVTTYAYNAESVGSYTIGMPGLSQMVWHDKAGSVQSAAYVDATGFLLPVMDSTATSYDWIALP